MGLDELEIENAYTQALADDNADVVNSSFGVCESQDPAAEYDFDQLALQGASKGMTFVAATGDGGSMECPGAGGQNTVQGIDVPSAGYYFTALGAIAKIGDDVQRRAAAAIRSSFQSSSGNRRRKARIRMAATYRISRCSAARRAVTTS